MNNEHELKQKTVMESYAGVRYMNINNFNQNIWL